MAKGYLQIILHAHLPYVRHPEYERFLEERWLFEAVTETYIPLIKFFDQLRAEGAPFRLTLSISPTLANMLEDPLLQQRYLNHLDLCIRLADKEIERTRHWGEIHNLARMYRHLFGEAREVFTGRCQLRLARVFKEFSDAGCLELMTCAATHGFLPVLNSSPATVRAQIFAAVHEHQRIFGQMPKGIWIPECGYYPGLEKVLAEAGLRFFVVDSHAIELSDPKPLFGVHAPLYCPSGVAAFGRNPSTSRLVWSDKVGYPGDHNYREYHRDIGYELEQGYLEEFQYAKGIRSHTGIKYHKITGPTQDKHLYNPGKGREVAENQARDFVNRCRDQARHASSRMPLPAVIVSPYDAELFGHWWFEGPQWIYYVLRETVWHGGDLALSTPGDYLKAHPVQQLAIPAPSTWGRNGYNEHWVNQRTEWMWGPLHEAAERMTQTVGRAKKQSLSPLQERALTQAGRELMLAQSSDWPFIITNGTTEQYARRRFHDHLNRCHDLLQRFDQQQIDEKMLSAFECADALLPELDYTLFA
jgi:1,4-alpha-glucan branching enzyme